MTINVILYVRVSSKEQNHSGIGILSQVNEMTRYANQHGYNIIDTQVEVVSGKYHLDRRPVLKEALERTIRSNTYVMVSRLDRISRSSEVVGNITSKDSKYKWFSAEDGIDCDPMILQIKASVGESFRNRLVQRGKESSAIKRAKGIPMGMNIPAVRQHKEAAIKKSNEAITKEADDFALFMEPTIRMLQREGKNFTQMAKYLNTTMAVHTQRKGKWWPKTVSNLVSRIDWLAGNK